MSGWLVLSILHFVGWGFCTLWVLGTCWKERMWGNVITWFNWWQAFILSEILGGLAKKAVVSMVGLKSADDQFIVVAVWLAIQWGLFIAVLAGLKLWSEKLSRVKVAFHPVMDGIGNFIFCMLLAGSIVLSTLQLLGMVLLGALANAGKLPAGTKLEELELAWLTSGTDGGLPWQMATLFCGYWVLVAVAVAVLSRPSGRLDKPKKDQYEETEKER